MSEKAVFYPSSESEPQDPIVSRSGQKDTRIHLRVKVEDMTRAMILTKTSNNSDVFAILVRIAEEAQRAPPMIQDGGNGKMPLEYNRDPQHYNFHQDLRTEKLAYETWLMRSKAMKAELDLRVTVTKMSKQEIETVIEAPKMLVGLEDARCYKCHEHGHWASQCTNAKW